MLTQAFQGTQMIIHPTSIPNGIKTQNETNRQLFERGYVREYTTFAWDGRRGIPNLLREALLANGLGALALALDVLYCAGWQAGKVFDFQTAYAIYKELGISERLARHSIATLKTGVYKGYRGRPRNQYQLAHISTVCRWIGVDNGAKAIMISDPLRCTDIQNLPGYRLGLYREFISRTVLGNRGIHKEHQRAFLAARLGVSKRATRTYDKMLSIDVRSNYRTNIIFSKALIASHIAGYQGKRGCCWIITDRPGSSNVLFRAPLEAVIAYKAFAQGRGVYMEEQLPNLYFIEPTGAYEIYRESEHGFRDIHTPTNEILAMYSEYAQI